MVITPAAPAAAATRTQAPRLPRWRGSSSRITGAGPGWATMPSGSSWRGRARDGDDLRARDHRRELPTSTTVGSSATSGASRADSAASSAASAVQTPSSSAPKRTACLTA